VKNREGLVLKSPDMKTVFKYTANQATNHDLSYAFKFMFDYGQSFMFRRIVRQAFQAYEMNMDKKQLEEEAKNLGESILYPMVETVKQIAAGKEVTEDFEIEVPSVEFGDYFVDHLNHLGVRASIREIVEKKEHVIFKLSRHYPSTNDTIKSYLKGEFSSD
jgi:putative ATP-dependent DNA ligase